MSTSSSATSKTPFSLPAGTVDTHCHAHESNCSVLPTDQADPAKIPNTAAYKALQQRLGFTDTVLVQANIHQLDNSCLLKALADFKGAARGVATISADISEHSLQTLHLAGVRGARFTEFPGGAANLSQLADVSARTKALGWHSIVQFDGAKIDTYLPYLAKHSTPFILDHIGKFQTPTQVSDQSFQEILRLIDKGNCYVKLAAMYESSRVGAPSYDDVKALAKALIAHAPERIIWASNWPHLSVTPDNAPDDNSLLELVESWMPSEAVRQKIFVENPRQLYDFSPV